MNCVVCRSIFSLNGAQLGFWGKYTGPICDKCYDKNCMSLTQDKWLLLFKRKISYINDQYLTDCEKVISSIIDSMLILNELELSIHTIVHLIDTLLSHIEMNKRRAGVSKYLKNFIDVHDNTKHTKVFSKLKKLLRTY